MAIIREEKPGDEEAVRRVNLLAFGQPDEADLVDKLRDGGKVTLSLVAIEDNQVLGHILFTPVSIKSDDTVSSALAIGPMSVLPDYQNRGIGSQLVEIGLESCRAAGHRLVFVLGHPNYYPRFGFVPARTIGVSCQFDVPDEVFMVKQLAEPTTDLSGGVVKYLPEFLEVA